MAESININSFILQNKIGAGSFATVYKIIEKATGNNFAAKIMNQKYDQLSIDDRKNLKREINIMTNLNHPGVIKFIGFSPFNFKRKRYPMFIMEYLPNKSLKTILDLESSSTSPPSWDDTKKLINIYAIASAMSYLHANNIIHRDLKPDNILMDEYLFPRIADFGLSKFKDTDQSQAFKGTPVYSPPEVFSSFAYSFASDVYAYGLIIYEIVTNEKPFFGLNIPQLMAKLTMKERPEIDKTISDSYRNLIEKCWSHDPEDRPTFDQIVELLETDEGFITDTVDRDDYYKYIDFIKIDQSSDRNDMTSIQFDENLIQNSFSKVNIFFQNKKLNSKRQKIEEIEEEEEEEEEEEDNFENLDDILQENNINDKEEIVKFYKKSADKGNLYAMVKYGEMLFNGDGIPENKEEAVEYFKMASDYGNLEGMVQYGNALFQGEGIDQKKSKALKLFKKASYKGNLKATIKYADCLFSGDGIKQNKEKAILLYKRAADKGELEGIIKYANYLYKGEGTTIDKAKAIQMYKKAADKGDIESMYRYGNFLYNGVDVPVDKSEAARYFKMAADFGHIISIHKIALMLSEGDGIKKDIRESCHYYKILADKGDLLGMNNYAVLLLQIAQSNKHSFFNNEVDIYNFNKLNLNNEAANYFKMAADKGCLDAINNYANILYSGEIVPQNFMEAVNLYKFAAEKGHIDAMNNYANLLMKGIIIPKNEDLALQLFRNAADKGHRFAAYNLALLLEEKQPSSIDEIKKYLKMAADRYHNFAAYRYAQYLLKENNEVEAMKYLKMSADQGNEYSSYLYGKKNYFGESKNASKNEGLSYIYDCCHYYSNPKAKMLKLMFNFERSCNIF